MLGNTDGARGDGTTLNTQAIATAISAAARHYNVTHSAGFVRVPSGVFLSGQIVLQSGVYLELTAAAVLTPSIDVRDFPLRLQPARPGKLGAWPFVYSDGAHSIGIVGTGTIDGGFEKWIAGYDVEQNRYLHLGWNGGPDSNSTTPGHVSDPKDESRPRNVILAHSVGVLIDGVTLTGSPDWTVTEN